ncbi:MAG: EFR1 family ferrodoxin [Lachnospiraceae bacterium]|nr:EFR1 family ferrodoxin [Lachnospiraceae bacterium]
MIFYFSGTGNSKGIAEIIAQNLNDEAIDIIGKDPESYHFTDTDYLGFVFPVYAYAAPDVMIEFVDKMNPGDAFTFGICTFSNVAGCALQHFSQFLPLKCGYGVKMPDTFPVLDHILETEESAIQKLEAAKPRVDEVIDRLKKKEEVFDVLMGENPRMRSFKMSVLFNAGKRKTNSYWTEETCTGCGLCAKLCPANAIEIQNNRPVWIKEDCYLCMACLNRCPVTAIQYGPYSKGRFRYYFKGFDTSKYFK